MLRRALPRRVSRAAAIIGVVAAAGCASNRARDGSSARSDETALRETIAKINREFPGLARARNAEGAAAWFAPDAIVYVNGMPPVRGRDAIRAFYAGFFEAMPIREMTFSTEEITQRGEIGVESGTSTLTIGPAGETGSATVGGKYLAVWKQQPDGQWLLWRHSPTASSNTGR